MGPMTQRDVRDILRSFFKYSLEFLRYQRVEHLFTRIRSGLSDGSSMCPFLLLLLHCLTRDPCIKSEPGLLANGEELEELD